MESLANDKSMVILSCLAGGDMVAIACDCSGPGCWKQVNDFLCNEKKLCMQPTPGSKVTRTCQGEWCDGEV